MTLTQMTPTFTTSTFRVLTFTTLLPAASLYLLMNHTMCIIALTQMAPAPPSQTSVHIPIPCSIAMYQMVSLTFNISSPRICHIHTPITLYTTASYRLSISTNRRISPWDRPLTLSLKLSPLHLLHLQQVLHPHSTICHAPLKMLPFHLQFHLRPKKLPDTLTRCCRLLSTQVLQTLGGTRQM